MTRRKRKLERLKRYHPAMCPAPRTKQRCSYALFQALSTHHDYTSLWRDFRIKDVGLPSASRFDHPCFEASAAVRAKAHSVLGMSLRNSARWLRREQKKTALSCIFCGGAMGPLLGHSVVLRQIHKFWGH